MDGISSMGNASLMLAVSTATLTKAIDSSEAAMTEIIDALSSGESSGLDIYA